ncbi:ABC transporter permease [Thalassobacillus pellis]|uniref:ABC transporter permease n=1 Tax=Thalassobacillus pellis TaxID=748008 RepID=UPI0019613E01|nr:ABC transporter permease [Thalassobacillus pellis]MBM7551698.1 teichoic acid transport system permease protein [Thalassobacillus pellis]
MKAAFIVLKEQIKYFYLVRRLSWYEMKSSNMNTYLGVFWELLNPAIQIAIYWFVFGFGIRGRDGIDGVPFFQWMLAGIVVWFLINQGILQASKSIYTKIRMLSKMNFPMSVIPNYVIFSKFYPHLMLLGLVIVLLQFLGYPINIYYIQLPLYTIAVLSLLFAISLITSTLSTIIRDVQMLLQAVLRMLLYLSPILWNVDSLDQEWLKIIMKINPFYYIVEGYRHSLIGQGWYFIEEWQYTLYFIGVVALLFLVGSMLHVRFRRHFIDFL